MLKPLSVSLRWTLRYSAALLVTVSILGVIVYDRVERRIRQDAELLLDHQAQEIRRGLLRHEDDPKALEVFLAQKVDVGTPMVGLGIAVYDKRGRLRRSVGSLRAARLKLPAAISSGEDDDVSYEADLGRSYRHFVTARKVRGGYLQVSIYSRPFVRRADHIVKVFLWSIPAVLILTGGVGLWLARSSLKPISEMTALARRISATHLEEPVPTRGSGDELDQLAETLNDMLSRIRDGVERTRRFSGEASRELRVPLVALRGQIQDMLSREGLPEWHRRDLRKAQGEVDSLAEAVHAMLRLAWSDTEPSSERRVAVPMASLLENVTDTCVAEAAERGVELRHEPFPAVSVLGDPFRLHQLVASLLEADLRATPGGGYVELACQVADSKVRIVLSRSDSKEDFLAGPIRAVATEILRAHGGCLEVEEGGGTPARTTLTLQQEPKSESRDDART